MKNFGWKRIVSASLLIFAICMAVPGRTDAASKEDASRYVDGTKINGLGVSGMTVEEAKAFIESFYQGNYTLRIKGQDGKQEILHDTEIGYKLTVSGDLNAILEAENAAGRVSGPDVDNSYSVEVSAVYDEALLEQQIQKISFLKNAKQTQDARISDYAEGEPFTIIPEIQGNDVDAEKVTAAVKAALSSQQTELDLAAAGCYRKVQIFSNNEELKKLCDMLNQYSGVTITYVFGDQQEVLSGDRISQWIRGAEGTNVQVDEAQAAAFVKELADKYDTFGKPHAFHATSGEDVTVQGAYGWRINQAEETAALIGMIRTGESQSREPAYLNTAASRSGNDYGNTYVEVDLKNQHMYLYENGVNTLNAPFVSGNVSKGWATPDGLYTLTYKERNRVLRGAKKADGTYEYESPVSYWMPFNGGIGLHDANWRGKFGGTIYKTGGSHGCINLPPAIAAQLYDRVYKGIPVICHGNGK